MSVSVSSSPSPRAGWRVIDARERVDVLVMVCKGISEAEAEVRRGSTSGRHDQRAAGDYLSGGVEEWRNTLGHLAAGKYGTRDVHSFATHVVLSHRMDIVLHVSRKVKGM